MLFRSPEITVHHSKKKEIDKYLSYKKASKASKASKAYVKSVTYNFSSPISAVATIKPLTPSLSHPESCEGKWIADMETKVGEEECARNSDRPSF